MKYTKIIAIYLFLIGMSAVLGGYNLIVNNGGGMPVEWLAHSPFSTFFLPGVILAFVVGGTHVVAAIVSWMKYTYAPELIAVAGFGLLIWIFTEIYMINHTFWLQIVYFGLGIITLIISILLLRSTKRSIT